MTRQIPNGVIPCHHLDQPERDPRKILFAGRLNRKGLNFVIESMLKSDLKLHLLLAGDYDLYDYTKARLNENDFTYLGRLSRPEVALILHQVKYVACISQYYDNYPTIALEAIAHGALPITTELTGVASLVSTISLNLVIKEGQTIDFSSLDSLNLEVSSVPLEKFDLKHTIAGYREEIVTINLK